MAQNQCRDCYKIPYKLSVIEYTKDHGNRAIEWYFGLPPNKKMIQSWRKQEKPLKDAKNIVNNLCGGNVKWTEIEGLKTWVLNEQNLDGAIS